MIGRLMLSLKRAADTSTVEWSLTNTTLTADRGVYAVKPRSLLQFARMSEHEVELHSDEGIPLETVSTPVP